jgi:hypothetical protein
MGAFALSSFEVGSRGYGYFCRFDAFWHETVMYFEWGLDYGLNLPLLILRFARVMDIIAEAMMASLN